MKAQPRTCVSSHHVAGSCGRLWRTYSRLAVLTVVICSCSARLTRVHPRHLNATFDGPEAPHHWLQPIMGGGMRSMHPKTAGNRWLANAAPYLPTYEQAETTCWLWSVLGLIGRSWGRHPQRKTMGSSAGAETHSVWSVFAVTPSGALHSLQTQWSPVNDGKSPTGSPTSIPPQSPGAAQPTPKHVSGRRLLAEGPGAAMDGSDARTFMLRIMPDEELLGIHNFNGGLIALDNHGNYSYIMGAHTKSVIMVYRASVGQHTHAQLLMVELHPHTFEPTEAGITVLIYRRGHHQDPRLFTWQGRLWMSSTVLHSNGVPKVAVNEITGRKAGPSLFLDLNDKHHRRAEKNWALFPHNGALKLLYHISPLRVHTADLQTLETVPVLVHDWLNGTSLELRGGAPPVLIGQQYYTIVHSRKYEVYVVVLNAVSLRVVAFTPEPVVRKGSDQILFPVGVLYTPATERLSIAMGMNDKFIGIVQITKRHVDNHLVEVQ